MTPRLLPATRLALAVLTLLLPSCTILKEGYRAACIDACRAGGAAQGTSRCERGCRSR